MDGPALADIVRFVWLFSDLVTAQTPARIKRTINSICKGAVCAVTLLKSLLHCLVCGKHLVLV
jgi:hypothetical protein